MSDNPLVAALGDLTEIQRRAVDWNNGALLVLAGPGSGKTQVLTCRIARLLDEGRDKNFRILALTFTNKAADEMMGRVANFVPGLEERANIGTFHSFCGQVLRQHGVHLGIKPDFAIYSDDDDRKIIMVDALRRAAASGANVTTDDVRLLGLIDRMKAHLVEPTDAERALASVDGRERIALVYQLYEQELKLLNALDFNSLILEAHRLAVKFPALAARYRTTYPFWLLDEFQDTNSAQYRLVKAFAGDDFHNIFAVADDDQIIYQWNGASFRHIQAFRSDFHSELIQLPTNFRCPPAIVDAANRLVAYNAERTSTKSPLVAGKTKLKLPASEHIRVREYEDEEAEAKGVASEISGLAPSQRDSVAVLARTRAMLERVSTELKAQNIPAQVVQRRGDFLSAEIRWMVACLTQIVRPIDKRNLGVLVEAFNRFAGCDVALDQVIAASEASGRAYLSTWLDVVAGYQPDKVKPILKAMASATSNPALVKTFIDQALAVFDGMTGEPEGASDIAEDLVAWRELSREISKHIGRSAPLDQFLQELQMRSKEPSPKLGSITLMTIHAAKGREFDYVYVIGLADDVIPSFQSKQKGDKSAEMEEERRNCFVAITRTKESLTLSYAHKYRGWSKSPSRFLVEMGFVH